MHLSPQKKKSLVSFLKLKKYVVTSPCAKNDHFPTNEVPITTDPVLSKYPSVKYSNNHLPPICLHLPSISLFTFYSLLSIHVIYSFSTTVQPFWLYQYWITQVCGCTKFCKITFGTKMLNIWADYVVYDKITKSTLS